MRRIAWVLILLASVSSLAGCRSIHRPWARMTSPEKNENPLEEPKVRTARDAVPDSVMLRDQAGAGYRDFPAAQ